MVRPELVVGHGVVEPLEVRRLLAAPPPLAPGDLAVQNLECASTICVPGKKLSVAFTVANVGHSQLLGGKSVLTEVRLTKNKIWGDSDDLVLASFPLLGAWPAGYDMEISREMVVPRKIPDGAYRLAVMVDVNRTLKEASTVNNRRWFSSRPTLMVSGWDASAVSIESDYDQLRTVAPATDFWVTYTVANYGRNAIKAKDLVGSICFSKDKVWGNNDDVQVYEFSNPADLKSGAQLPLTTRVRIPAEMRPGEYFVGMKVSIQQVKEPNQSNNTVWSPNTVAEAITAPDIAIDDVQFDGGTRLPLVRWTGLGLGMNIQVTMSNKGRRAADMVRWRPWLSKDAKLDRSDVCLFSAENKADQPPGVYLDPGDKTTSSFEAFVPLNTRPGDYFLLIDAVHDEYYTRSASEPGNPVNYTTTEYFAEENTENNLWRSPGRDITVAPQTPYVTWTEATAWKIEKFKYGFTVKVLNLGGEPSSDGCVTVYAATRVGGHPNQSCLDSSSSLSHLLRNAKIVSAPVTFQNCSVPFTRLPNSFTPDSVIPEPIGQPRAR